MSGLFDLPVASVRFEFAPDMTFPPPGVLSELGQIMLELLVTLSSSIIVLPGLNVATVTSFYRDPARNARVGGVANSLHLVALAIDLRRDFVGLQVFNAWRRAGLGGIDEGDHYHLQLSF